MIDRESVRCPGCELVQFKPAAKCRRCHKPLDVKLPHKSMIFGDTLPTVKELELLLINEALKRADGDRIKAAKLIGLGKTTLYRKIKGEA